VIGAGTYAMRAVFLVTARHRLPAPVGRLLPYVGPAVLAAIALPAFVAPHASVSFTGTVPALLAAVNWHNRCPCDTSDTSGRGTLRVGGQEATGRRT
jgi:hypothetical protein